MRGGEWGLRLGKQQRLAGAFTCLPLGGTTHGGGMQKTRVDSSWVPGVTTSN